MALVSAIVPCFNEREHIDACLESLTHFELPTGDELEMLVIDGDSTDETPKLVEEWTRRDPRIRLMRNPSRYSPHAMNIGVTAARGEYIARIDAHSVYPRDYLRLCLETIRRTGADNVGGTCVTLPRGEGYGASVVQALTTHKFGVGDSGFRTAAPEGPTDTVPYGFFRRNVFDRVGRYDERLIRAQDYEFNRRIRKHGGTIWINPAIHLAYYQQPTIHAFLSKQIALEAPYNAYLWYAAPYAFAPRHAVTAVFAVGVLGGIALLPFVTWIRWTFVGVMALYGVLAVLSAIQQAQRFREWRHVVVLPAGFFAYHFLHGVGVLWGLLRLATRTAPVMRHTALVHRSARAHT